MGKTELVEFIAAKAGLTKAYGLRDVYAFHEGIQKDLKKKERLVQLVSVHLVLKNVKLEMVLIH